MHQVSIPIVQAGLVGYAGFRARSHGFRGRDGRSSDLRSGIRPDHPVAFHRSGCVGRGPASTESWQGGSGAR